MKRYNDKTQKDLSEAWVTWQNSDKCLRFGQYIYNNWDSSGVLLPDLYYEEDEYDAYVLIQDHISCD